MINKLDPSASEDDPAALRAALIAYIEKSKDKPWYGYLWSQIDAYFESQPQEAELKERAESLMQAMWTVNQPRPHCWVIRPADG